VRRWMLFFFLVVLVGMAWSLHATTSVSRQLVIIQASNPSTLNPNEGMEIETVNVTLQISDGLVRTTETMGIEPALATDWEMLDSLTWKFYLRRGVEFHNGEKFTAEDVKFTIDRILDPALYSKLRSYIEPISEVQIQDDYAVIVRLWRPYALLLRQLANVLIIPKNTFERMTPREFGHNPVGTGPFKFAGWVRDQEVILEAFDDHWRGRPNIDKLVFRSIAEPAARVELLTNGVADIIASFPLDQIDAVEKNPSASIVTATGLTQVFLVMNAFHAPFNDIIMRKAILYSLNPQEIVDTVLKGYGAVNAGPFAPLSFGHNPYLEPYGYHPNEAMPLVAEGGCACGYVEVELVYQDGGGVSGVDDEIARIVAKQLRQGGIFVTLRPSEKDIFTSDILKEGGAPHLMLATHRDRIGDADSILGFWYDSARRAPYYHSRRLDQLIQQSLTILDPSQRLKKLHEIAEYMYSNASVGFLVTIDLLFGVNNRVRNWKPRGDGVFWVSPEVYVVD